jgi:3-oxoacyl-[acyl-carrier protein] reductase
MRNLEGKTALVTGASRGIGRAICVRLAREGANIVGVDIDLDLMDETAELVRAEEVDFLAVKGDVVEFDQMKDAVSQAVDEFGSIDVMVNNAGITRDNLLIRMGEQDWDAVIDINLKGVFNCVKAAARPMMKQREGRIINIASVVGIIGNAGQANYSASKGGVIALTKTSARELAARGVAVNAVAPGFIETPMTEELSEEAREASLEQIPFRRYGTPEDVAAVVSFLAGPDASYMTGQVLRVDGGMVM